MKRIITLVALLFCASPFFSQGQALPTGQQLPGLSFSQTIHTKAPLKLTDYRGKAIVFDFWNQACSSCIDGFPELVRLQKRFGKSLQIILVNRESRDSTLRFFRRHPPINTGSLPMITGDRVLSRLFPYIANPYQVWIDRQGIYRYLTDADNATPEHLRAFISGRHLAIVNYVKPVVKYLPVMAVSDTGWRRNYLYFSYISPCSTGVNVGFAQGQAVGKSVRLSMNCSSAAALYRTAYAENGKHEFRPGATLVFEVQDTSVYQLPADLNVKDAWLAQHGYDYDLMLPAAQAGRLYQTMQEDLQRFFGLSVHIERRNIPCMVLVKTGAAVAGPPAGSLSVENLQELSRSLAYFFIRQRGLSFADETGAQAGINISLRQQPPEGFDPDKIAEDLRRQGFDLVRADRPEEVLVVSDR
jgi:thiol-disulfide isomerase/thioredoxin